jgi:YspA, cpYpsA-related SLOG family
MKVIIAGSRGITSISILKDAIFQSDFLISEVVSGCAQGVDSLGELWANENGVPISRFPADWDRFGRAAGMYRNSEMAEYADAAIILWDGSSRGTLDMIDKMRRARKPMEVWIEGEEGYYDYLLR